MWRKVAKYLPEFIIFVLMGFLILRSIAPDLTWMMCDQDSSTYLYAAKFLYPAPHTSAPLYLLIGHLFLQIPIGADYFRLSLLSWASTLVAMVFLYLAVRYLTNRFYGVLAMILYGGSALIFAQSTIVETYALVTMCSIAAFYFTLKKNWVMVSVFLGVGLVVHHLILLTWVVLFGAHKELRNWKRWGLSASFLIVYLYLPIASHYAPDIWYNTSVGSFFTVNFWTFMQLVGGLPIWDLPTRIVNTFGVLGLSLGIATLIPIVWWIWKKRQKELLWLFVLPIIYVATDLALDVQKYMAASIAFGVIIACLGLYHMKKQWIVGVVTIVAIYLAIFNSALLDIGTKLDPNLSATKFYNSLYQISDGEIYLTNNSWAWQTAIAYNINNKRNILPVSISTLHTQYYQNQLEQAGIKFNRVKGINDTQTQGLISESILQMNPNVWMDRDTDPKTFGLELVKGDNGFPAMLLSLAKQTPRPTLYVHFSNPYDYITGAIQVEEWAITLKSNYTCALFGALIVVGIVLARMIFRKEDYETGTVISKV